MIHSNLINCKFIIFQIIKISKEKGDLCDIKKNIVITTFSCYRPRIMSATRVITRSSPTEGINIAECVEKIDQLSKRSRHASKTGGADKESTPAETQSTPTAEDTPPRQPESSDGSDINPAAANLWHQLFKSTDYVKLAGNRDFFHKRVKKLLTNEQALRITEALGKDVINRKVDFLKSKETDTAKLRLSLQ